MRLIDGQPVWPAGCRPQFLDPRQQSVEEAGTLLHAQSDEIDYDTLRRIAKQHDGLVDAGGAFCRTQRDGDPKPVVVTFRINHAELVRLVREALEESAQHARLARTRCSRDQKAGPIGTDGDGLLTD